MVQRLAQSIGAVSTLALLAGGGAAAQTDQTSGQDAQDEVVVDEIVVTARRREERLIDTPLSVTAVSGEEMQVRDITDLGQIDRIAPNVNFSFGGTSSGSSSAAVAYIRGVGQNDFTPVTDPGVGIYVDGVYLGRTVGSVLDVFDIQQVEILRGPQGTLFGRNTIGGAISLTTRDPAPDYGVELTLAGGGDRRFDAQGRMDIPLADGLGMSVSGLYRRQDGYVDRVLVEDDDNLGNVDEAGGRIEVLWQPTSAISVELSGDYFREREESAPEVLLDLQEDALFINFHNDNTFGTGATNPACAADPPPENVGCATDEFRGDPTTSFETGPSRNDVDTWGVSGAIEWDILPSLTVKSITAYRDLDAEFARASDGTPFDIFSTQDTYDQWQVSQEIQAQGTGFGGRLDYVAGFFYFKEEAFNAATVQIPVAPLTPQFIGGATDNDNWAVFGEGTYDLTSRLHLTGGLRYTEETKRFDPVSQSNADSDNPILNVTPGQRSLDFEELTWRASLAYDLTPQNNIYFTASKGFKSGGFVLRLTGQAPDGTPRENVPTFLPEELLQYEAGLKGNWIDAGLRYRVAAFFSDYTDIQVAGNPPGEFATVTTNAAEGEITGVEVELNWRPPAVPGFAVDATFGWIEAEYTAFDEEVSVALTLEDEFIRTPQFTWNMRASYEFDLGGDGFFTPAVDWTWRDDIHFEPVNNEFVFEDGYHNVDVSASWQSPDRTWRFTGGINNLTDAEYLIAGDSNDTIGYALGVFARPRVWYLKLSRTF
mgnify:CR=1 FL=1